LLLALGSTAAVAWGLSTQRVLGAAMPDRGSLSLGDRDSASIDGAYCPLPPKATVDSTARHTSPATAVGDTLLLFGGQSAEPTKDSAQQAACPGVPLPP
jgi:hypothetical protein